MRRDDLLTFFFGEKVGNYMDEMLWISSRKVEVPQGGRRSHDAEINF